VSRWRRELDRLPDRDPSLPLDPEPATNGEFIPAAASGDDLHIRRLILDECERAERATGIDRRRLLQSSAGVAASLALFNAIGCSPRTKSATRATSATSSTVGGTFTVPPTTDISACEHALGSGGEFIFDVHTHHVVPDGPWRQNAQRIADMIRGLVPAGCRETDPFRCVDRTAYLHDMFLASDTTIALLSDVPNSGPMDAPLPWEAKRETRRLAQSLAAGGAPRVLIHDVIAPNFGDLRMRLDEMDVAASTKEVAAFKVYTAWGPQRQGFALDSEEIGIPVVEKARALGVRVICGHKGLPLLEFDPRFNGPRDMVALSRRYPDMQFVIYHGAYERETSEGPYDAARANRGINSLVKALQDHGVGPNENVWAELGTTWREVLRRPTEAAHAVGKLLRYVGEDRVLWGTDAVWYGSPQPQIMAFRAFEISKAFQELHGYPELTAERKRKVFGTNAAALFGVDPVAMRCAVDADALSGARQEQAAMVMDGAIPTPWEPRGPLSRREFLAYLGNLRAPWTP
jgi:predicted TIM-barrel fold metal-dependent hydrolase